MIESVPRAVVRAAVGVGIHTWKYDEMCSSHGVVGVQCAGNEGAKSDIIGDVAMLALDARRALRV